MLLSVTKITFIDWDYFVEFIALVTKISHCCLLLEELLGCQFIQESVESVGLGLKKIKDNNKGTCMPNVHQFKIIKIK